MCDSRYSDMSILTIASLSPKMNSATLFASSVLPTPDGPMNRKDPMGLLGSFNPALDLLMDLAITETASSCPTTFRPISSSILRSRFVSSSVSWVIGTPVQEETIWAIDSSPTSGLSCLSIEPIFLAAASYLDLISSSLSRNWAAFSYSWSLTAVSFSAFILSSSLESSTTSGGATAELSITLAEASSTRSIALSGRCLSGM